MRRARTLAAAAFVLALALAGCSSDDDSGDDRPSSTPVTVEVSEQGGEITTSKDVVEAERGQEIELIVSSDAADEFHVHSEPEQELTVKEGDDQVLTFSIDTAGEYEMESHELEVTILKLQIS